MSMPKICSSPRPFAPCGRHGVTILTGFIAAVMLAACAERSRLYEVPSQVAVAPSANFAKAVDSARIVTRKRIRAGNLPGVSIAVGRASKVIWSEAFGWSDLSADEQATPRTLYPVGSISKSMTATAAGVLYQRGRLDFNVPIQTYLPEFPQKRWPITTGQVMGHIAGLIRDAGVTDGSDWFRMGHCDNARARLAEVSADTLLFEPGTRWRYSNFGYRLVGAVVEAVAREPFLDFMDREVFTRAGMEQTVPDLGAEAGEAVKYDRADLGMLRQGQTVDMSCPMAAGGFLSTPTELVRFGYAMLNRTLLDSATVDLFWTPQRLKTGAPTEYGFGWSIDNVRLGDDAAATTRMIGHGGAVLGGQASLMIFPEEDMVVAVMTNGRGDPSGLARAIAGIFRNPKPK
jgi:serine beta-lactamase-like protein LACTB, mitochondrial